MRGMAAVVAAGWQGVAAFGRRYAVWHHLGDLWRAYRRYRADDALLRYSRLHNYQRLLDK